MDNKGFEKDPDESEKGVNGKDIHKILDSVSIKSVEDGTESIRLRRLSKRVSIVIDENDKIWAPNRRASRLSGKLSLSGSMTNGVLTDDAPMSEVHLGHSTDIRRKSLTYLKKELEIDYHEIPIETLYNRLGSHPNQGLDDGQAKRNLEKYGKNMLTPPKKEPLWLKFVKTLFGGFQLLLWVGSILSFAAYATQSLQSDTPPQDNLYLGSVLAILVVFLGMFTFYQEYSSGKIMESFSKMVPSYANCIRNGKMQVINAADLVVGDIVEVKFGDRIPADIRIITSSGFKVDNSSLTGESDPQLRIPECTDENPMETKNLAFFSTNALEGTAKGIVVSVGDNTFIGRIAGLTSGLDSSNTPLAREISHFVKLISAVAVFFGVTFFAVSLFMGYAWIDSALFLIGIIVANVPEGLLVTFTVILALTAKRMADKNCLVKQLHAVETLGSTTVICSDKTGTLTQNRMTVNHMWFNDLVQETNFVDYPDFNKRDAGWVALTRVGCLCSRATFLAETIDLPIGQRKINGDASEAAILRSMEENVGNLDKYREQNPKVFEIPFNSTNKWQLSIHETQVDGERRLLVAMKGAPERIINMCSTILIGDKEYQLDSAWKARFNSVYEELGGMGERVLGFCDLILPADEYPIGSQFSEENTDFLKIGMRFVGLMSMIDPPRPGVPDAVKTCRSAGIKVVMVTGDHPITAKAIAKSVGIISPGNETLEERAKRLCVDEFDCPTDGISAIVVKGEDLLEFSTEQLDDVLRNHKEIVFARVSPQQKLVIVEGFQRLNEIVAVTGDGVNDSPALKKANIGIAMGIAGSDVSKQAADMILLDDNFASIVTGVEEGRLIFENLKKCICYLLAANIAELVPFIVFITLRIPLPLGTIPMLMICLGTDIVPTISLSYEKPEGDIMKRPPRDPVKDNLVTDRLISYSYGQLGVIEAVAGMFTYFVVMGENGFLPNRLIGIAGDWDNQAMQVTDSFGQEWSYYSRKALERTCWTAYFCSVVVCQWANLLISKCRRQPLYTKLFDNWVVFLGILIETGIACLLTYTPGLNHAISYMSIKFVWWLPAIPFAILILTYDESRRFLLRNWKNAWFQHEFYY